MAFRVVITPEAQTAIDRDLERIHFRSSFGVAQAWYLGLIKAIASLSEMPERCSVIPEQRFFSVELRQLLYGRKPHMRRIIFSVVGEKVFIVRYQHGSLRSLGS
ncbi:MAG: plasmid stabilization system protein ParE [Planctomycetota bacterium]|jgi:plasmid stabilization system protein ParE